MEKIAKFWLYGKKINIMSYTTFIEQGKINNARDFMKLCLCNFGIMQEHYQDPLSLESVLEKNFDVETNSSYQRYVKNLDNEYQRLKEFIHQQEDKTCYDIAFREFVAGIEKSIADYKKAIVKRTSENKMYEKYIEKIQKWNCSPQYENIKKFAIEQCTNALNEVSFYTNQINKYEKELANPRDSFDDYLETMIYFTRQSIDMYAKSINTCVNSLKERKEFFDNFMKEVNNIDNKIIEHYE